MGERQRAFEFMDGFPPEHHALFESAAERVALPRGEYLLRRGEPGGDVYLLTTGTLEVVDTRSTPEVILAVLKAGATVGEMAFVDDSPRSADVRAGSEASVLRWTRDDLRNLLRRHPDLAANFFESVAKVASARLRRLTEGAVSGAVMSREGSSQAGLQRAREGARAVAETAKARFLEVDSRLRHDARDPKAPTHLIEALEQLQRSLHDLLQENLDPEARSAIDELLSRELHPYVVRSTLAERCIRRPQGVTGTAEILAHVLAGVPSGDGPLGEHLDRWFLARPSLASLRGLRAPTVAFVKERTASATERRILILNAGTGDLVTELCAALADSPTVVSVVDQSRDALAVLDANIPDRPDGLRLDAYQENLAQVALGHPRQKYTPQDVVVVHGMLEYLPERLAVSLLVACRQHLLRPEGALVVSALAPSDDHALLDRLLDWPTIRRTEPALHNILTAAGFKVVHRAAVPAPAMLLAAEPAR